MASYSYADPVVARYARRRRGLSVWFWLAAAGIVLLVVVSGLLVAKNFHFFESADERLVREYFEDRFTPFAIEEIKKYPPRTTNDGDSSETWQVKLRRPAPLVSSGTVVQWYNLWLLNGEIQRSY